MAGVGEATINRLRNEMHIPNYRYYRKEMNQERRQRRLKRIEENKSKSRYQNRRGWDSPVPAGWNRITLPEEIVAKLGTMPDYKLGEIAGVSKKVISRVRREMGIPSYAEMNENKGQFKKGMPHPRWNKKTGE